jgi:hypothetical protein
MQSLLSSATREHRATLLPPLCTAIVTSHKVLAWTDAISASGRPWGFGEPRLNDLNQPIIYSIAHKLGCIRPHSNIDLPLHSIFPENAAAMTALAYQLEGMQRSESQRVEEYDSAVYSTDVVSLSELCYFDIQQDCMAELHSDSGIVLSPQRSTATEQFQFGFVPDMDINTLCNQESWLLDLGLEVPETTTNSIVEPM